MWTPFADFPITNNKMRDELVGRVTSATIGAVLTSLIISPLEVVKVRLQSQASAFAPKPVDVFHAASPIECSQCKFIYLESGFFVQRKLAKTELECPHTKKPFTGTVDALRWIIRNEGARSLFNGIQATIYMSIPATVLYFASYEELRDRLNLRYPEWRSVNPLVSGMVARVIGGTIVAPLELIRTQAQSSASSPRRIREMVREIANTQGVLGLWRGLSPTLWRDVPFSGMYWILVEKARRELGRYSDSVLVVSSLSGAGAGMVAALFTHPFDVVKTRRQVFVLTETKVPTGTGSTFGMMRHIVANQGLAGLMVGVVPRVAKIAPSTAIMLTSYELGKRFFRQAL